MKRLLIVPIALLIVEIALYHGDIAALWRRITLGT